MTPNSYPSDDNVRRLKKLNKPAENNTRQINIFYFILTYRCILFNMFKKKKK